MSNFISDEKFERFFDEIAAGNSIRKSGRLAGIDKNTATTIVRDINKSAVEDGEAPLVCQCGKPLGINHRGFCRYRFASSPARQEFMRRWHSKQKP